MTDRAKTLTVVLDGDDRADDLEAIRGAFDGEGRR